MKQFGAVGWQSVGKGVGEINPEEPGLEMARGKN